MSHRQAWAHLQSKGNCATNGEYGRRAWDILSPPDIGSRKVVSAGHSCQQAARSLVADAQVSLDQ